MNENEYLWEDKKRIWGLPISFTKYWLDNQRLYVKAGFFNSKTSEILLYRILDIESSQTLWQKLFKVGNVTLYSADKSDKVTVLVNIKNPTQTHKYVSELIEGVRAEKGLIGKEMIGTADNTNCDCH